MSTEVVVGKPALKAFAAPGFRHTRVFLLVYYLLFAMWGVRSAWPTVPSRLDIMVPLALYAIASCWVIVDDRARGRAIPLLSQQWFFLAAGLLVPVYVIWSRGWRGVGYVALHGVLGYLLATVCMNAVALFFHLFVVGLAAKMAN
jgi:hypothetical protein